MGGEEEILERSVLREIGRASGGIWLRARGVHTQRRKPAFIIHDNEASECVSRRHDTGPESPDRLDQPDQPRACGRGANH
jgi:hypothetical protein